ncbi:precorrin-6y C5,15-methyltransferase (decarboxylating) subunit CbiE [Motiliproteus sp. MSK22-1]|uniref:precorrin-6y C5,15-methyltransferase (decarboxylating) subunit CbiE n=1 Tax=Motiliproteus sp. MSK22-1 TaxID=1897630 RepID=UPI000976471D|nr:precorrin-6y C5,15-methyltransferase (decarboxylating) subunit CbiE [Motiliproteus sp. MSK22-1]OMH33557.1 precorrin-6Y C5,15-methyltransferase [Motiliproteus sp. MSK22-1]
MQLHIIGLGVCQTAQLDSHACAALAGADLVIGSERQLETVSELLASGQKTLLLPNLKELKPELEKRANQGTASVAILASGDPLFYGIGRWFSRQFDAYRTAQNLFFYPAVSSVQAACHRLALSLQDVTVFSLHGRPLEKIRTILKRNKTLVILTDKCSTPQILAQECIAAGFAESQLIVCESLGYPQEKVTRYNAVQLATSEAEFDPLHVTVIETRGPGGVLPEFPGIPDASFVTDAEAGKGMLTKREVRLAILSLLQGADHDVIWDVGAGCGGVAVELSYWNKWSRVYAVEHHADRLRCLEANRQRFGVTSNLTLVPGRAPEVLKDLPPPDKVFIGGSDGELAGVLQTVWSLLPAGGVLVASAVTETTKQHLLGFYDQRREHQDAETETLQIAVNKGDVLAGQLLYRPALPVTLFRFVKGSKSVEVINISGITKEPEVTKAPEVTKVPEITKAPGETNND